MLHKYLTAFLMSGVLFAEEESGTGNFLLAVAIYIKKLIALSCSWVNGASASLRFNL